MDGELRETLEIIFAGILIGSEDESIRMVKEKNYPECISKFTDKIRFNIFSGEFALLYSIMEKLNIKVFNAKQLEIIMNSNEDLILKSPLIDLDSWEIKAIGPKLDRAEKVTLFEQNVLELFSKLSNKVVTVDEFISSLNLFITYIRDAWSFKTAQNMTLIDKDGIQLRTIGAKRPRQYKGAEGRDAYYSEQKRVLDSLLGTQGVQSTAIDDKWLKQELEMEQEGEEEGLLETGLGAIDDVTGPLRRSNVLGILGPPKGGKTKMANYLTAIALESGLNVAVWILEGTREEWTAMQTAAYIRMKSGDSLNSNDILNRKYKDNLEKQAVIAAKTSMVTNKSRGKLTFLEGTAYVENFVDTILTHYRCENQFDVSVIDSLVNIQSLSGRQKVDRISEAFIATKDLVAHKLAKPALGILTAQLKQSTIDWLRSHPDETMDVTAGGESAETIRTPDIIYGLFSSKDERLENKTHIYCVGSRHSEAFPDFLCKCELNCAYFEYDEEEDI